MRDEQIMIWIGLLIGMFLGANIGLIVIAMCIAANKRDEQDKGILTDRLSTLHARGYR
jgi:uncharacterized membrane-anchored protein YhcB (DUF1043 family)